MKYKVLDAIKLKSGKVTFKMLNKRFNMDSDELKKILLELKLDGEILQLGNQYMIFPEDLKIGTIIKSASGNKYICYKDKRIIVPSIFFSDLVLDDVVSFKFINDSNEFDENAKIEIVSIIDRPLSKMTCTIINVNGKKAIVPYREELRVTLSKDVIDNLSDGDVILVDITPNEIGEYCNATFIKKVGRIDDPSKDEEIILLNYGFNNDYSLEYLEEISKYPTSVLEKDIVGRYDFRSQKSFTIDSTDTKDMDDGVYAEIINDEIVRVYVHIADVSHYVKRGSEVFKRACDVTTSVYTDNSVFHMLHYIISNGICSLNPNEDRLTKTVIMDIDKKGNIINFNIVKSVINSKKKMNYEDVDKILINDEIPNGYEDFVHEIMILKEAAVRLEKRYNNNGKINYINNETNINDELKYEMESFNDSPARIIIENLMIAANETVAQWLFNMGIPAIYRIYEAPDVSTINNFIDEINNAFGFNIRHITNVDTPKNIQRILDKVKNSGQFPLISQMLVLGMQRARYSAINLGHFILWLDTYLHFTSPIRRLADLIVHMITDMVLEDFDKLLEYDLIELEKTLEILAEHASKMERRASLAVTDCEKNAVVRNMQGVVGSEFEAIICEIDKKIKVRLNGIDAYVDIKDFSDDFWFDNKKKTLYEITTGKYIKLGTKMNVRLMDVNITNMTFRVKILNTVDDRMDISLDSKKKLRKKVS